MGGRRPVLVALALVIVLGVAVYVRLWSIDYNISSVDADTLRREFDLANKEAMDESAEWRHRYDQQVEIAAQCQNDLIEIKQSLKKVEDDPSLSKRLEMLQKENVGLVKQLETLRKELEAEKLKCKSQ
ncbi:hypothetical protein RJ641_028191 [Dillenia turbinata]|uniref:Uncharacterized protein n=1 Tax=Dillenia turbinata TaxID=194707 RepID=A0AAN8W3W5_9MAGN